MADNVVANSGSGGATFATASGTWSGDTANFPGCFLAIVSGSEGSWTISQIVGGAGAVSAGVQRMTLASDDPAVASLAILDDWDESDRAKVNLIVGQAGIAAGAGSVGATVPRVTLASDDPGVVSLQLIDDAIYTDGSGTPSKAIGVAGTDGTNPQILSVNSSGHVNIADGGNTITVDGTVSAAQSGTWNITNVSGTVSLPTGASTLAEQQSQTTHLATIAGDTTDIETAVELIDDCVVADDAAFSPGTTKVMMAGFEYDDTGTDSVNEGDAGAGRMSANRCQYVMIRDNAGNERGLNIDASGNLTANITGTVTVGSHAVTNAGTFATQATLQTGDNTVGRVKLTDGTDVADILGLSNSNPLTVAIVDGSGDQITSFGGGTQYTEGDTDATITGTAILWEDGSNTLRPASAAKPLPVEIIAGAGSGGTAATDDAAFTAGTTSYTPVGGIVTSDSVDSGDGGAFAMLANRQQKVTLYDSSGVELAVGGGTQYTEDAAAAANPIGNALMLVREDARAGSLTNTDGDNVAARGNNKGELYVKTTDSDALLTTIDADTSALAGCVGGSELQVDIVSSATLTVNSHAVTNAGTFAVQVDGSALTALQLIDNVVHVDDAAFTLGTHSGVMMMGFAGTQSVDANDAAALACTTAGALHVSDAGGSLTVDNGGTFVVQENGAALTALQVIDNPVLVDDAAFTPGTSSVMMAGFEFDDSGTDSVNEGDAGAARMSANRCQYVMIRDNAGNERGLNIDASGQLAVTLASSQTLTTVTTVGTVTTVSTLTGGGVAHDSGDSGNPIKIGARAAATLSDDTMVANADRTDAVSDLDGALVVRPQFPLGDLISEAVSNTDGASTAFTNFGATASTRSYITSITVFRTDSGTSLAYVDFRDGTGGSVLYRVPLPPSGGATINLGGLPIFRTTANTALAFDVSAALTTVYISVSGFKSKV